VIKDVKNQSRRTNNDFLISSSQKTLVDKVLKYPNYLGARFMC
jgi:hypothetical protein